MKNQLKALQKISEEIKLENFYVVSIYSSYITLQGFETDELIKLFDKICEFNKTDNGWIEGDFIFEDVSFNVTLT